MGGFRECQDVKKSDQTASANIPSAEHLLKQRGARLPYYIFFLFKRVCY